MLTQTMCPLWNNQTFMSEDTYIHTACYGVKDFSTDGHHQDAGPEWLQSSSENPWITWFYSPRAGGAFCIQGQDSSISLTVDDIADTPLRVQERAALSYHLYQHNFHRGWLRRVPSNVSIPSYIEDYLDWEVDLSLYGPSFLDSRDELDHLIRLQNQPGQDDWLNLNRHRYPSAEERLLSFIGEVIRQTDRDMPQIPLPADYRFRQSTASKTADRLIKLARQRQIEFLLAAGACRNDQDWNELINEVKTKEWIKVGNLPQPQPFVPTLAGRRWYEQRFHQIRQEAQGFIAMWFPSAADESSTEMEKIRSTIEDAISEAGYRPYCVINDEGISGGIDDEIIAQIRQSRFLVADLTDLTDEASQGRRNVYYEAGFAYGQGLDVIYTCKRQQFEKNKAAFDIQQMDILQWDVDKIEGKSGIRQRLTNRILARLGRNYSEIGTTTL